MSMGASRWILTSKGPAEVGGGGHGIDTPSEAALPRIRPVVLGVWVGVCVGVWIGVGEGGGVGDGAPGLVRVGVVGRGIPCEPRPFRLGLGLGGDLGRVRGRHVGRRLVCGGVSGGRGEGGGELTGGKVHGGGGRSVGKAS